MSADGPVAALILAAGGGTRLQGGYKLLLPWAGGVLVQAPVRSALSAGLDPIVAVVGHRGEEVRDAVEEAGGRAVSNPRWSDGQSVSLAVGVRHLREETPAAAAAVLLGDEPGLRPDAVRSVVAAWREGRGSIVRARYRDRPGHPVVFDRSCFEDLEALGAESGPRDGGARDWMDATGRRVEELALDVVGPVDVDTRDGYEDALGRARR